MRANLFHSIPFYSKQFNSTGLIVVTLLVCVCETPRVTSAIDRLIFCTGQRDAPLVEPLQLLEQQVVVVLVVLVGQTR